MNSLEIVIAVVGGALIGTCVGISGIHLRKEPFKWLMCVIPLTTAWCLIVPLIIHRLF